MRYIDFDGVILDTEDELFREWKEYVKAQQIMTKVEYIQQKDWREVIANSPVINNSLDYLRELNPKENTILTKVHTLENEGKAKVKYLESKNIKLPIILVSYRVDKCDVVSANGNILIDDCLYNLKQWKNAGGIPQFFDRDENNIDSWGEENIYNFPRVRTLR